MFGDKARIIRELEDLVEVLREKLANKENELKDCKEWFQKVLERPNYAVMTNDQVYVLAAILKEYLEVKKEYLN